MTEIEACVPLRPRALGTVREGAPEVRVLGRAGRKVWLLDRWQAWAGLPSSAVRAAAGTGAHLAGAHTR